MPEELPIGEATARLSDWCDGFGALKGQIRVADDFDEPLADFSESR
jgi:hypothetical protein